MIPGLSISSPSSCFIASFCISEVFSASLLCPAVCDHPHVFSTSSTGPQDHRTFQKLFPLFLLNLENPPSQFVHQMRELFFKPVLKSPSVSHWCEDDRRMENMSAPLCNSYGRVSNEFHLFLLCFVSLQPPSMFDFTPVFVSSSPPADPHQPAVASGPFTLSLPVFRLISWLTPTAC